GGRGSDCGLKRTLCGNPGGGNVPGRIGGSTMNKSMLAGAALVVAAAVAMPVMAWSDDNPTPQTGQGQDWRGHGGMWRHEDAHAGMRGEGRWGANRSPQQA